MSGAFRKPQPTGPSKTNSFAGPRAADISRMLAERIESLVCDLLPNGHREGHEWCAGNVRGDAGSSLGVHLVGSKAGVWSDFSSGERGDALDLVAAVLKLTTIEAMDWARRWLGIDRGEIVLPRQPPPKLVKNQPKTDPDRWQYPWNSARPIGGTLAETYLAARGLRFDDPDGRVLRFVPRRARKHPETDELEYHPALLAALSDIRTGEQCGLINIYLRQDGHDRIRDRKAKTVTGRPSNAAVMLDEFEEVTMGLVLCEGVETGIALFQNEAHPVWACGSATTLKSFPVLNGIEAITIAADRDAPGQAAANELAEWWRTSGLEAYIIVPPQGDWGDRR